MVIPVLWVSLYPETILARGYADEGMLEAILDRTLWTPQGALEFEHREVNGPFPDDVTGALVVIPCRHHVEDAEFLCQQLDRLDWSVVILAGDEAWDFPWELVTETETRRVWTMQPIPEHAVLSGRIPGGWYQFPDLANTRELIRPHGEVAAERPFDWFFAGQDTHERRHECVEILGSLPGGKLATTDGYLREAIPRPEYFRMMAATKIIPSPSGPYSVDCARTMEALEAGCIPVVDQRKPRDPQFDYWSLCFGDDYPFRGVIDWAEFPSILRQELANWKRRTNLVYSWWQRRKRAWALQLDSDLRAVSRVPLARTDPNDRVTFIVTSSPTPGHPSIADLEETIGSLRAQLPDAEIVVVFDGVRDEQWHRKNAYEEYVRRALWAMNFEWHNIVPIVLPDWRHQALATKAALELVTTPLVCFVEHDTPLIGEIDWPGICDFLDTGEANTVRFHIDVEIHPDHEGLMLDHETVWRGGLPVRRCAAWWQRPHVARTDFYRERVLPLFPDRARCFIEDYLYGIVVNAYHDRGEAGWWDWRIWVYTPDTPVEAGGMKRSGHLDSRGEDPKYGQLFPR